MADLYESFNRQPSAATPETLSYDDTSRGVGVRYPGSVNLGGGDFFATHGAGQNRRTVTFSSALPSGAGIVPAAPTVARPEPFVAPEFKAPTYDKREVAAEAQRLQAPSLRRLRQALQQAQTQRFENLNVRRMTLREALAGYGAGLESAQTGARREARQVVGQQYQRELGAAQTQFGATQKAAEMNYQRAWDEYLRSIPQRTTRTTTPIPTGGTSEVITRRG